MDTNTYLLAKLIQLQTGETIEDIINEATAFIQGQPLAIDQGGEIIPDIEEIYRAYPTKDVVSGRNLGKCAKDKLKIKSLLKTRTKDSMIRIIKRYISECEANETYMKNFGTFLNQFPDEEPETVFDGQPTKSKYR